MDFEGLLNVYNTEKKLAEFMIDCELNVTTDFAGAGRVQAESCIRSYITEYVTGKKARKRILRKVGLKKVRKSELEQKDNDKAKTSMIALGPTQFGRPVGEGFVGVLPQDEPNDNALSLQLHQDSSCPSFIDGEIEESSKKQW